MVVKAFNSTFNHSFIFCRFCSLINNSQKTNCSRVFITVAESSEDSDSKTTGSVVFKPDTQSVVEGSAFDENTLNQSQFIHLTEKFLGDAPKK